MKGMSSPTFEPCSVFVYGTLMPGERWEKVARRGGDYTAQPATLGGVALADLRPEGYPALFALSDLTAAEREAAPECVSGYLYTYTPQSWATAQLLLDDLEGLDLTPPLYRRERVTVQTAEGLRPAWVYLYARTERRLAPGVTWLKSGRWHGAG